MILLDTITSASPITLSIGAFVFIVAQIGAFIIAWTNLKNKIATNKRDNEVLSDKLGKTEERLKNYKDTMFEQYEKIEGTMSDIKATLGYIKGKLEKG